MLPQIPEVVRRLWSTTKGGSTRIIYLLRLFVMEAKLGIERPSRWVAEDTLRHPLQCVLNCLVRTEIIISHHDAARPSLDS